MAAVLTKAQPTQTKLIVLDVPDDPVGRGAKVGAALGEEIRALFEAWTAACDSRTGNSEQSSQVRALSYASRVWPVICKCAPSSAREIDAIAAAARVPRLIVVALNCYDELGLVAPLDGDKEEVRRLLPVSCPARIFDLLEI